jgi:tetraacyldisaccharide 4'-kinase
MAWDLGLRHAQRLDAPVIGVGNLVAGGAGKTPLVMALVGEILDMGLYPVVISRGYGRRCEQNVLWVNPPGRPMASADQAGDEPVLLARRLDVPVWVGADRWAAGKAVLESLGRVVLVADDLFQHRRLHRDLNILVLDAAHPLGNGRSLPRGPLREPVRAMGRASAVVLSRAEDSGDMERARRLAAKRAPGAPVLPCRHRVSGLRRVDGRPVSLDEYQGQPVLAFCGLARPDDFSASLEKLGLVISARRWFGDHHAYAGREVADLWKEAGRAGARALVCSEKDAVRLPADLPPELPLWVTRLELEFPEGREALRGLLADCLKDM